MDLLRLKLWSGFPPFFFHSDLGLGLLLSTGLFLLGFRAPFIPFRDSGFGRGLLLLGLRLGFTPL